jgi:hypothetical protein
MRRRGRDSGERSDRGGREEASSKQSARDAARLLAGDSAAWVSVTAFIELPVRPDPETGCPPPLAKRTDGVSCGNDACRYRFTLAVLHGTQAAAARSASKLPSGGEPLRYFARLTFRDALAVDATSSPELDEQRLRANDPRAVRCLQALKDEGVDAVWIRARQGGTIVAMFADSLGQAIRIDYEGPGLYRDRRWQVPAAIRFEGARGGVASRRIPADLPRLRPLLRRLLRDRRGRQLLGRPTTELDFVDTKRVVVPGNGSPGYVEVTWRWVSPGPDELQGAED